MRVGKMQVAAIAIFALLFAFGCGDDESPVGANGNGIPTGNQAPDFALADVNSSSATNGEMVSPRDYEGKVSAWYFGRST